MKLLVIIFAFVAGTVLIAVGLRQDSLIDLLIGGFLVLATVWECSQLKRDA